MLPYLLFQASIKIEKQSNTLDSLIVAGEDMKDLEWGSMMIQVIMMLPLTKKRMALHIMICIPTILCMSPLINNIFTTKLMIDIIKQLLDVYTCNNFGRAIYKFREMLKV